MGSLVAEQHIAHLTEEHGVPERNADRVHENGKRRPQLDLHILA